MAVETAVAPTESNVFKGSKNFGKKRVDKRLIMHYNKVKELIAHYN